MAHELIAVGGEFRVNTYTNLYQWYSSQASLDDGGFVVVWGSLNQDGSNDGIYAQRYNADGQMLGVEFRVNTYTTSDQERPSLTALTDGGFVVSWQSAGQDGSGLGVYAQRYNGQAQAIGGEFRVNTTTTSGQFSPSLTALMDGGFVASWGSQGQDGNDVGIYAQRYNAQGQAVGGEFQVNTTTTYDQQYPSLTTLANGGFVASWQSYDGSGYGIYAQRYDAQCQTVGGEFRVNTYTINDQWDPNLTALVDGGFVAIWTSNAQDGGSFGIYAQRFNALGQTVGGEFRVNTYITEVQQRPSLTALADGGFVASWMSYGQDGNSYGAHAQRYNAQGLAVGGEFRLNTYTANDQGYPSLSALSDGGFVASWMSNGQDGSGYGIYAQRYGISNIAPQGVAGEVFANGVEDASYAFTQAQLLAGFSDADGDNLSIANLTSTHGSLSYDGNGNWTFTPDANYYGAVQFDYDVVDGYGGSVAGGLSLALNGVIDQFNLTGGGADDILSGDDLGAGANDVLSGQGGNDQLYGHGGNDTLRGGEGNDILDGGSGADYMAGGAGDDTYVVDNVVDVVDEPLTNSGIDTIISLLPSYRLIYGNHENLILGSGAQNGTGNWIANVITGNEQNNVLHGGDGNDTLYGLGGNDELWGDAGADAMFGGQGDDRYFIDNAGDTVSENAGEGIDTVSSSVNHALGAHLENVILTGTAANGAGNELDNLITGNSAANILMGQGGNDVLDGKAGVDQMAGGQGNDFYYVDNTADAVTENVDEGIDTIQAQLISYSLSANVENLILTGWHVNGTGNALNNSLTGSQGANILDGGLGMDQMAGGKGNDTYLVDNAGDVVTELLGEGSDTVISSVSYALSANVEKLTLTGSADLEGWGNGLNNVLTGNSGANVLMGGLGSDTLSGGNGDDTLLGEEGADRLTGGAGADWFGITGALGTGSDTITDFQAGTDLIVLDGDVFTALGASIDAGEFRVSPWSAKALDANDFLLFVPSFGGLFYDADGNGAGAAVHIASLTGISSLDVSNLFLYFPPSSQM